MATGGSFTIGRSDTSTTNITLDASGNLGLGVTPSAWNTNFRALQFGGGASLWNGGAGVASTYVGNNYFLDSGGNRVYIANGTAAEYAQLTTGVHAWYTAPSGTAGNAISFTQAMTLDASGNLGLGNTNPASYGGFVTQLASGIALHSNSTSGAAGLNLYENGTGRFSLRTLNGSAGLSFYDTFNGTERARITSGGDLLVGTTSAATFTPKLAVVAPGSQYGIEVQSNTVGYYAGLFTNTATSGDNYFLYFGTEANGSTQRGSINYNRAGGLVAYNTTSDYRAKDILGPVASPGATIDALKVYEGQMKGATQSRPMLVAHEAQAVAPYSVTGEKDAVNDDGTPKFQQMDVSSLVPLLIAEIQSLRARVAALEA
jgi:hypothetical protein